MSSLTSRPLTAAVFGLALITLASPAHAWSRWRAVKGGSVTQIVGTTAPGSRNHSQVGTTPPARNVPTRASITGQQKVGDTLRVSFTDAGGTRRRFSGTVAQIQRKTNGAKVPRNKATTTRFEIRSGQMLTAGAGDGTYLDVQITRGGRGDGKVSIFANRTRGGVPAFTDFDGTATR